MRRLLLRPSRPDHGPVAPPGRAPTDEIECRPIGVLEPGVPLLVEVDPEWPDGPSPQGLYRARRRGVSCYQRLLPSAEAVSDVGVLHEGRAPQRQELGNLPLRRAT